MNCGYCRSYDGPGPKEAPPPKPRSGAADFFDAMQNMPTWVWLLFTGVFVLIAVAFTADYHLPPNSRPRALWATIQLGLGLAAFIGAQTWALIKLMPRTDRLSAIDALYPLRLWPAIFEELPDTCRPLCLAAWGLTAVLSAVLVVGGLSYWLPKKKPVHFKVGNGEFHITDVEDPNGVDSSGDNGLPATDAGDESEDWSGDPSSGDPEDPNADHRPTANCVVIGYVKDKKGALEGLVLALESEENGLRYVGVVRHGITPENAKVILQRLAPLARRDPPVPGVTFKATWLKPEVRCIVLQSGLGSKGTLVDPSLEGLLK
jgi:hypothetical protein